MNSHLEHANLCVAHIEPMTEFLLQVFPQFRIRGEGLDGRGRAWRHVGDDDTYLALQEATTRRDAPWVPYSGEPGLLTTWHMWWMMWTPSWSASPCSA